MLLSALLFLNWFHGFLLAGSSLFSSVIFPIVFILGPPYRCCLIFKDFHRQNLFQRTNVWKGSAVAIFSGVWVGVILWSCGRRLRIWLALAPPNRGLRFGLDWGFGIALFNLLWMGLGLVRLWYEPLWLIGFLTFSLLASLDILKIIRSPGPFWNRGTELIFWFPLAILYIVLLVSNSILPETFYDSLNYFLGMPCYWLFQHGISDYPTHLLSGYFHGGSLFFTSVYVIGGTEGAKCINVVVLGMSSIFVYAWVKEFSGKEAGLAASMAVLTFPLLYLNTWAVRVDGLLAFSLLLFFYCSGEILRLQAKGESYIQWIWASALFSGLALSIKPTGFVGILAAGLALLWMKEIFWLKDWKIWSAFILAQVLELGPWLLKNKAFTGNPFFPYAISWMGGRQFSQQGYARLLNENQQYLSMPHGLFSILSLPWRLTMPQAGDGQFIGPLILAFIPVVLMFKSTNLSLKFQIRTMGLLFLIGLTLSHMLRFTMPAFLLALICFSSLLMIQPGAFYKRLWIFSILSSAILCLGAYFDLSLNYFDGAGVWSGRETREDYLIRKLPDSYESLVLWTDQNLPTDSKLLIVGDSRGVYYRRPFLANSVFDDQELAKAARNASDPQGSCDTFMKWGSPI